LLGILQLSGNSYLDLGVWEGRKAKGRKRRSRKEKKEKRRIPITGVPNFEPWQRRR